MSTTTTPPDQVRAGQRGDPSPDPTGRPTTKIPAFARARAALATAMTATETTPTNPPTTSDPSPEPVIGMAPREPGTSPGPGRDLGATYAEPDDTSGAWSGPDTARPATSGRRTSSSDGERRPGTKELTAAVAGALFVLAGFTAWSLARTGRWTLRVPNDGERSAAAAPIARIVDRHVGAAFLTPDLVDGVAAASAVAAYAATNPLHRTDRDPTPADPFDEGLDGPDYEEI